MDELRAVRKTKGLCVQCGIVLDRKGICCKRCNSNNNKIKAKMAEKLHRENKCTDCRETLDRLGWFCSKCLTVSNNRAREKNAERRANGQCVRCGDKVSEGSYCKQCRKLRMKMYYTTNSSKTNKNINSNK